MATTTDAMTPSGSTSSDHPIPLTSSVSPTTSKSTPRRKKSREKMLTGDISLSHDVKPLPSKFDIRMITSRNSDEKRRLSQPTDFGRSTSFGSKYDAWTKYVAREDVADVLPVSRTDVSDVLRSREKEERRRLKKFREKMRNLPDAMTSRRSSIDENKKEVQQQQQQQLQPKQQQQPQQQHQPQPQQQQQQQQQQ